MKHAQFVALLFLCIGAASRLTADQATPRYTNAELVSVNAQTRLVVIKNTQGREQKLQVDDKVAGLDGLRAGDRVILTVRAEPGMYRVSSIVKSIATTPAPNRLEEPRPPAEGGPAVAPALRAFADRVASLGQQAGAVDSLWSGFKTTCKVTLRSSYPDGRDWFSLWDNGAQMDLTSSGCRDQFNQIVGQGETVKAGMTGAEEAARKAALAPGDLREVRRRYSMEWGGWSLAAPGALKQ